MSEHLASVHEAPQKTPQERQEQLQRISKKLLERASRLPSDETDEPGLITSSRVGGSVIRVETDTGFGDLVSVSRPHANGVDKEALELNHIGDPNTSLHKSRLERNRIRTISSSVGEDGFKSTFMDDNMSYNNDNSTQRELTPSQAAQFVPEHLMDIRGEIAAHEIAHKQAAQK